MKQIRLILFIAASLLVLAVVSYKVVRAEISKAAGTVYRFPVQGYDPRDIFRGRYLAIGMESESRRDSGLKEGGKAYGVIAVDGDGLAYIDELTAEKPVAGDYLVVNHRWGKAFEPPFSRFYLNEKLAPKAEDVLRDAWRGQLPGESRGRVVLEVKVCGGFAVVSDLLVDGRPIRELLQ